jgi:hypothetical protein
MWPNSVWRAITLSRSFTLEESEVTLHLLDLPVTVLWKSLSGTRRSKAMNYNLKFLLDLFKMSYMKVFGTFEASGEMFDDGVEMLTKWFNRQDWTGVEVISVETKTNFELKSKKHEVSIPFNYIFDRLDVLERDEQGEPTVLRIVDYKTNRWALRPDDLDKKIQARIYAMVTQMNYKNAKRIWVQFDLLRHEAVGRVFSREQNIATWRRIHNGYDMILEAEPNDEGNYPETLNSECLFCVRKTSCNAYLKNVAAGGVFSFGSPEEIVDRRALLQWQVKAATAAIKELDELILEQAKTEDVKVYESANNRITFGVSSRRDVDPRMVEMVVGSELFSDYGGKKIAMGQFDKMMKDPRVSPAQRAQLKNLIHYNLGDPTVKVESRSYDEDD